MGLRLLSTPVNPADVATADVIVLVEGWEGEIFPEQPGRIPSTLHDLDVVFVNCNGFPGVGSEYEFLSSAGLQGWIVPTVDQDSIEQNKGASGALTSPRSHKFARSFEEEFPDWMLSEALTTCLAPYFSYPEELVTQAKAEKGRDEDFYKALKRHGRNMYSDRGFVMPSKRELTRALRDRMIQHYWIPPKIGGWVKEIMEVAAQGAAHKRPAVPPVRPEVRWDVVEQLKLSGCLLFIRADNNELVCLDFDRKSLQAIDTAFFGVIPVVFPMWSPRGNAVAFQGRSQLKSKTVVGVLTQGGGLRELDVGGSSGTSLWDWDSENGGHLFVSGSDNRGYRLWWRARSDGSKMTPVEPLIGAGRIHKIGKISVGISVSKNIVSLRCRTDTGVSERAQPFRPADERWRASTVSWNYYSKQGDIAIVDEGWEFPDRHGSVIYVARVDANALTVVDARLTTRKQVRIVRDICWSPNGQTIIFGGSRIQDKREESGPLKDETCILDVNSGRIYHLTDYWVRLSGRSWFPGRPSFLGQPEL